MWKTYVPPSRPWLPVSNNPPPKDKVIETVIIEKGIERNKQPLILYKDMWFTKDKIDYVFYKPTYWRELEEEPAKWFY